MKRVVQLSLAFCLLAATTVHAGSVTSVPSAVPTKSAKEPVPDVNKKSSLDLAIVGKWKSIDAKNGATHGVITLNANGSATMQAEKGTHDIVTPLMSGSWFVRGSKLHLAMPPYGTSISDYRLNANNILVITYDNGNPQSFKRQ